MKIENNSDNKDKFFAQYWGQKLLCVPDGKTVYKYEVCYLDREGAVNNNHYLELRHLSSITDDEAVQVAKIHINLSPDLKSPELAISSLSYAMKESITNGSDTFYKDYRTYKYLQSRGFALPYHNLSVEDLQAYGWIKLT